MCGWRLSFSSAVGVGSGWRWKVKHQNPERFRNWRCLTKSLFKKKKSCSLIPTNPHSQSYHFTIPTLHTAEAQNWLYDNVKRERGHIYGAHDLLSLGQGNSVKGTEYSLSSALQSDCWLVDSTISHASPHMLWGRRLLQRQTPTEQQHSIPQPKSAQALHLHAKHPISFLMLCQMKS